MKETPRVIIYAAEIEPLKTPAFYDKVYNMVRPERRNRTDRYRFDKDKYLSLGAECLLMRALKDFGIDYDGAVIRNDKNGKPYLENTNVYFNLSHSHERVMCIISDVPVGCDVEIIGKGDMEIAKRFFSQDEYENIQAIADEEKRRSMFYRIWTLKESYIKCVGLGLRIPLSSFTVSVDGGRVQVDIEKATEKISEEIAKEMLSSAYYIHEAELEDGYRYSWCIRGINCESGLNIVSLNDVQ